MTMIRMIIRLVSLLLGIVLALVTLLLTEADQRSAPFSTSLRVSIDTSQAGQTKDALVAGLAEVSVQTGSTVLKVVADPDNYETERDVFWFGEPPASTGSPITDGQEIRWLAPGLRGDLLPAAELGDRPLAGELLVAPGEGFEAAARDWANDVGVTLTFEPVSDSGGLLGLIASPTGLGSSMLAVGALLVSAVVTWFVMRQRSRRVRLMAGGPIARIHGQDCLRLLGLMAPGLLLGTIGALAILLAPRGGRQTLLGMTASAEPLVLTWAALALIVVALSLLMRPTVADAAERASHPDSLVRVGTVVRLAAIALAVVIVPGSLSYAWGAADAAREEALWSSLRGATRVSFENTTFMDDAAGVEMGRAFLSAMADADTLLLSFTVDAAVEMTPDELGGFDHLGLVNETFLRRLDVGVERAGVGGRLTPLDASALSPGLREFMNAQFPLWSSDGETIPPGAGLYTYDGPGLLLAGPNVGLGGETFVAANPLVLIVRDPVTSVDLPGFLLPAMSTGNVFFLDGDAVHGALSESGLSTVVTSVDNVADLALDSSQSLEVEARLHGFAAVLIAAALVVAGFQQARLWAGRNRKAIFTLHTWGTSLWRLSMRAVAAESILALLATGVGSALVLGLRRADTTMTVLTAVLVAVVYLLAASGAHRWAAGVSFRDAIGRKD